MKLICTYISKSFEVCQNLLNKAFFYRLYLLKKINGYLEITNSLFENKTEWQKTELVPIPLPSHSRNFPDVKTRKDFFPDVQL